MKSTPTRNPEKDLQPTNSITNSNPFHSFPAVQRIVCAMMYQIAAASSVLHKRLVVVDLRTTRKQSSGIHEIKLLGIVCFVDGWCFIGGILESKGRASGGQLCSLRRRKDNMARRF